MSIFKAYYPLGLGTSRFPINGPSDHSGIEKSVDIVLKALELGVNYIDTSYSYSAGMAQAVLKKAFQRTQNPFDVTVKVMYDIDKTADAARKRVELQLEEMGLERAKFFTCWSIWNYEIFERIMEKGGVYEGAQKLKDEGIIDHICFSTHAPPADIINIIESGVFEGVSISYSLLNARDMQAVLDAAQKYDVGVTVMNPLGGGIIAQNPDYFSFACSKEDASTVHAALRFAKAHPAVDMILGGVNSLQELEDSWRVWQTPDTELPELRRERVLKQLQGLTGFCTGCQYCKGCPQGLPVSQMMQARNALLFAPTVAYNRREPELLYNIQIFRKLLFENAWIPEQAENTCIGCGACEEKCTQRLKIIDAIEDTFRRAKQAGFSLEQHKLRLKELLYRQEFRRVGLYPNGGFAKLIMEEYSQFFGEPEFEWLLFNSDPKMWGEQANGATIHSPDELFTLKPDIVLIGTYKYDTEIAQDLEKYKAAGIKIEKLHQDQNVPWVF